ncbi:hypothetical protein CRG98_000145 [Punica granatum]|uniref:Retrotransposon gag domain-containing protein n=1 Tax=Punica granatum TaxID=22663 RepID=A0A2I0LFJ9_PUNGR|nr:hypothetical protein CRG98_000145 [Punica granatum]
MENTCVEQTRNAPNVRRGERVQPREVRVEDEDNYGAGFDEEDGRDSVVSNRRRAGRFREARNRKDNNLGGIKMKISSFQGKSDPEAYLCWEKKVEFVFNCYSYSELGKVKLAAIEFSDYAIVWWDQLVINREIQNVVELQYYVELEDIVHMTIKIENQFKRRGNTRASQVPSTSTWKPNQWKKDVKQSTSKLKTEQKQEATSHEYEDVFPEETPHGLPPIRGIEYQIDFVSDATIPNRSAYKSNSEETKELQRQREQPRQHVQVPNARRLIRQPANPHDEEDEDYEEDDEIASLGSVRRARGVRNEGRRHGRQDQAIRDGVDRNIGSIKMTILPFQWRNDPDAFIEWERKSLRQGTRSEEDYHKEMEIALIRANIEEDEKATMARFLCGLNREIANVVELQHHVEIDG